MLLSEQKIVIMKILVLLLQYVLSQCNCRIKVDKREECQAMCDLSLYCDAWTFGKSDKFCRFKQRSGWLVTPNDKYESGFKNQGPWFEPNTDFAGGDYKC